MSVEPLYHAKGAGLYVRSVQTQHPDGSRSRTLGGRLAIAQDEATAAEIARQLNQSNRLLSALRLAATALYVMADDFSPHHETVVISINAESDTGSRELVELNVGEIIRGASAAIAAAQGRPDPLLVDVAPAAGEAEGRADG